VEASDCFQLCRGWLPGWCPSESDNCRLNRWCRTGNYKFSITGQGLIVIFLGPIPAQVKTKNLRLGRTLKIGKTLQPYERLADGAMKASELYLPQCLKKKSSTV
jgi:hypothetical protein